MMEMPQAFYSHQVPEKLCTPILLFIFISTIKKENLHRFLNTFKSLQYCPQGTGTVALVAFLNF